MRKNYIALRNASVFLCMKNKEALIVISQYWCSWTCQKPCSKV